MANYRFEKDISGCSLSGFMSRNRHRISGEDIIVSICNMNDRCNGLGAGYAAYGIYPEHKDYYAFHMLFNDIKCKEQTEHFLNENFAIKVEEEIPTQKARSIVNPPILWRYFARADEDRLRESELEEDDFVVDAVMRINATIEGAYVMSSGKNMGAFKAVGYPEDVGTFYRLDEYKAWTWISHGRFPTNTPGWWGGAHPFTLLDWAIVHNGEISSYGINKRYLEMFGYHCTLMTDTEVTAYLFDLLLRKHKLPIDVAVLALASPFWVQIDHLSNAKKELLRAIRLVYGSALLNGPFSFILGHNGGMIGLNDRIKLRPLVAAKKNDMLYIASEEAGIREICPDPDKVWMPTAGEPVIGELRGERECLKVS
ncbi:MAG: glutamine amidotransferase family protein [Actinomycetota bacterium]